MEHDREKRIYCPAGHCYCTALYLPISSHSPSDVAPTRDGRQSEEVGKDKVQNKRVKQRVTENVVTRSTAQPRDRRI